jgi:hypothetical protein
LTHLKPPSWPHASQKLQAWWCGGLDQSRVTWSLIYAHHRKSEYRSSRPSARTMYVGSRNHQCGLPWTHLQDKSTRLNLPGLRATTTPENVLCFTMLIFCELRYFKYHIWSFNFAKFTNLSMRCKIKCKNKMWKN